MAGIAKIKLLVTNAIHRVFIEVHHAWITPTIRRQAMGLPEQNVLTWWDFVLLSLGTFDRSS
jgi:hypothetical protein